MPTARPVPGGTRLARCCLAIGLLWAGPVAAQEWPTRAVTMVVPYAAGGTTDVVARILSPGLSEQLGQQVIVDNVSGAGGMIGVARVAKAPPDGYQFVMGNVGTHAQNPALYSRPLYDAANDFVPAALLVDQPMLLVVRKDLPANNLQEFMAYAKANQAKMQYGSAGIGSPTHLACLMLNMAIGINTAHVPYRGGGPAMQDLIAGRIDYFCFNTASIMPQVEAGKVRALALLSARRSQALPDLPTAQEQGLKDFEFANWLAFFLPRATPQPIVLKLHTAAVATLASPAVQERLRQLGAEPVDPARNAPDQLPAFVKSEIAKWARIIKEADLKLD
jgi:tripartite-type tricarboxylate transporter receptor subunit TctC